MHSPNPFVAKFASSIIAVLGCHDRVLFKGHLPFSDEAHLNRFVDHTLRIRRKDFLAFAEEKSELLVTNAKGLAARHGAPYFYLQGRHRTEDLVQEQIRQRHLSDGLVCVLCCQETCRTGKLRYGDGRPRLVFPRRPQRVLYFYFLDPQFGLRHIRVQTWFPSPPRSASTATTGSPDSSTTPASASCSTTTPSPSSTTPPGRKPSPTTSRVSAG